MATYAGGAGGMSKSHFRGYEIYEKEGAFYYADNDEPTSISWESRPCGHCGMHNTSEGHDGCLGTILHALNACCGHGNTREAYVQFDGGITLYGTDCMTIIQDARRRNNCRY